MNNNINEFILKYDNFELDGCAQGELLDLVIFASIVLFTAAFYCAVYYRINFTDVFKHSSKPSRPNKIKFDLGIQEPQRLEKKMISNDSFDKLDEFLSSSSSFSKLLACRTSCKKVDRICYRLPGQSTLYVSYDKSGKIKIYEFYVDDGNTWQVFTAVLFICIAASKVENLNIIVTYQFLDFLYNPLGTPKTFRNLPKEFSPYFQAFFYYVQIQLNRKS